MQNWSITNTHVELRREVQYGAWDNTALCLLANIYLRQTLFPAYTKIRQLDRDQVAAD